MQISVLLEQKGSFVATIAPNKTISDALSELSRHHVGALVVSDNGTVVNGIVSERDVVRAIERSGPHVLSDPVRSIMSSAVHTCAPSDMIDSLMTTMTEHRIRHVPVLDQGRLAGIVSIGDVVKTRIDELEHDRDALVDFIHAR